MTGISSTFARLATLLVACLVFALATAPAADAFACAGEGILADRQAGVAADPGAAYGEVAKAALAQKGAPASDHDVGRCPHGHCHQPGPLLSASVESTAVTVTQTPASRPAQALRLASSTYARLERPPRG